MRVLVIGSGGREHALAWKIAQSPRVSQVLAAPGSDAIGRDARCLSSLSVSDLDGLVRAARQESVDLVVVGPEAPLAAGLADRLRDADVPVFGPSRQAAQLESSKLFAKSFMQRHSVPTASFESFDDLEAARAYVRKLGPCVVKADGLAAGKGVAVCDDAAQAEAALTETMGERRFGEAGARVVIEERLEGGEASYYAITDGESVVTLAAAQDYKRALDGDRGENTGGIGACSPTPVLSEASEKRVLEEIVHPTLRGMQREGQPYRGVLYVGLMIDRSGAPRVIEFNVRFGDPETQALVARMSGDLASLLHSAASGTLAPRQTPGFDDAAVCVVLASSGYPRTYETGRTIAGLGEAEADPNVVVFHAGTRLESGRFVTAGGRVLGVTARGADLAEARARAYTAVGRIHFEGVHYRRDIAAHAQP